MISGFMQFKKRSTKIINKSFKKQPQKGIEQHMTNHQKTAPKWRQNPFKNHAKIDVNKN